MVTPKLRINQRITAPEVRVISDTGENLGLMPIALALAKAKELELDLIELSGTATPPIVKIADFGKYQYEQQKKLKRAKASVQNVEVKSVQVKIGTGEHDLNLKAGRASEWLKEGHQVKIDLFLSGRAKYLDQNFLKQRLDRILKLISVEYDIIDPLKRGPKGFSLMVSKKK